MSLINDALKKRQEAEQATPPPKANLDYRPPESNTPAGNGTQRFLWTMVLTVAGLNLALWLIYQDREKPTEARARSSSAPTSAVASEPVINPVASEAVIADPEFGDSIADAQSERVELGVVTPVITNPAPAYLDDIPAASQAVVAALPAPVASIGKPEEDVPLRLQSVIYHPRRPSAVINGRMVFVGDKVNGNRVKEIQMSRVLLLTPAGERTLTLP